MSARPELVAIHSYPLAVTNPATREYPRKNSNWAVPQRAWFSLLICVTGAEGVVRTSEVGTCFFTDHEPPGSVSVGHREVATSNRPPFERGMPDAPVSLGSAGHGGALWITRMEACSEVPDKPPAPTSARKTCADSG